MDDDADPDVSDTTEDVECLFSFAKPSTPVEGGRNTDGEDDSASSVPTTCHDTNQWEHLMREVHGCRQFDDEDECSASATCHDTVKLEHAVTEIDRCVHSDGADCSSALATSSVIEVSDDGEYEDDDIPLLCESDIPGASLNGKLPAELNVAQLKRWLACRGAPLTGKKPELIERVCYYIKFGWDVFLIDPDGGINVQQKLQARKSSDAKLIQSVPKANDIHWTKNLYKAPKVTFSTIYEFLVERKVLLKKAVHVDCIFEKRDCSVLCEISSNKSSDNNAYETVGYTRTLDKAYRFFQDGHVQNIRYHPMADQPGYICIAATVLPSMRKDRNYNVVIVLSDSGNIARVANAYCVCPAGLSGCCNHVTATLYSIEDYFHLKINEEDQKGCTEKLQRWNQPRKKKVDARPTDLVTLSRKVYGVEKRAKVCSVNKWDCRPTSRRVVQPTRKLNLRNRLLKIEQTKNEAAKRAMLSAVNNVEQKKAVEAHSMLVRYGTSCFLQLLDDEPAPSENRTKQIREERIARAASQKSKFEQELCKSIKGVNHDHNNYCRCTIMGNHYEVESEPAPDHLIRNLYEEHICISPTDAFELEIATRNQSLSNHWHNERKFRITASIMKEVCHRKPSTSLKVFIENKLSPKPVNSPAIKYGQRNEELAVKCYINYQNKRGITLVVHKCGLFVDPSIPWLAATPDGIVKVGEDTGCLEVKCPFVCTKKSIAEASLESPSFCLRNSNDRLQLKTNHQYFYQVQTQLFVTRLQWCDFVLWAPNEDIFVQRIHYDQQFIERAISKARTFYFDVFLPSVIPCTIISQEHSHIDGPIEVPVKRMISRQVENDMCNDVQILSVSMINKPPPVMNLLQQLQCTQHKIDGDGNCLYYAVAHQAGYIARTCHGDASISQQLRMLALLCMHKYPDVRLEDGISQCQWEQKKMQIIQPNEWGGDLELRLLAIGIGKEIVVVTGSDNKFTSARRFPCHPPPIPKMKGGIFIPVNISELSSQWKCYKSSPLLIIYNGINHYDSTIFMNN